MANNLIIERLEGVKTRFIEVGELLTQPDVLSDMENTSGYRNTRIFSQ